MAKRFIQYFEDSFKEFWNLPALTNYETKQTLAYRDVASEIAKLHILFKELNIKYDDKIAIAGVNSPEWAIVFLATVTYGAVAVPILKDYPKDDFIHLIDHSDSKLLFVDEACYDQLNEQLMPGVRAVFTLENYQCVYQSSGEMLHIIMKQLPKIFERNYPKGVTKENVKYTDKDDQELCIINYTSGSTGFSKGVMLTGSNIAFIFEMSIRDHLGVKGDRLLAYLPLAHTYGFIFNVAEPLVVGGHTFYMQGIRDAKQLFEAFQYVKPNWITMVPLIMEEMYNSILPQLNKMPVKILKHIPFLSSKIYSEIRIQLFELLGGNFRQISFGGAHLSEDVERFICRCKIPYNVAYGMTECSTVISADYSNYTPFTVGKAIKGVSIKINSTKAGEAGEIWVKGPNVMKGYYKDEQATLNAFSDDGWFKTGDLGYFDRKQNLHLKGRCKNMILGSSGQNIYPEEIESKINNLPYIVESVVLQRNNKLIALVYPNFRLIEENSQDVTTCMEDCRNYVNKHIAHYEYIHEFVIHNTAFEKTPKKNIKRHLYK